MGRVAVHHSGPGPLRSIGVRILLPVVVATIGLVTLGVTDHPLFTPADKVEPSDLTDAVDQIDQRDAARRLVLPDGIGEEIRVLVQGRGVPTAGWSFQRGLPFGRSGSA